MEHSGSIYLTAYHAEHDPKWMTPASVLDPGSPSESPSSCLACIVEMLEDPSLLLVKKKLVLSEMLRLLGYHGNQVMKLFREDERVTAHVALILVGGYFGSISHT